MDENASQAKLVEAARSGDVVAWEALYRSVYPRLRAYVVRRAGPAEAEDLVNETMARAIRGVGRFRLGPAGFDGWVFGIARHVVADHHRGVARSGRTVEAASQDAVVAVHPAPEDSAMTGVEHMQVRAAFERLGPKERELLELRVVAGLSTEQVADVLGKRPGAVRTAQSRALEHLRRIVTEGLDA